MTHARSQQYPRREERRAAPPGEEIELRCEAVGGDPTRPPLAGLPPVLRGVWRVRTFVCYAVNVCVLETQKCSLSCLPRDRLNTSPRKTVILRSNRVF